MAVVAEPPAGEEAVVCFTGEIDIATAPEIVDVARRCLDRGHREVVIDASQITFMDSQGLRALITAEQTVRMAGGSLRVRRPSRQVRRLLELSQIHELIPICD